MRWISKSDSVIWWIKDDGYLMFSLKIPSNKKYFQIWKEKFTDLIRLGSWRTNTIDFVRMLLNILVAVNHRRWFSERCYYTNHLIGKCWKKIFKSQSHQKVLQTIDTWKFEVSPLNCAKLETMKTVYRKMIEGKDEVSSHTSICRS